MPISTQDHFLQVYHLALNNDEAGLKALSDSGISLDVTYQLDTPLTRLAVEGQHDAVNLLIQKLECNINYALLGYARVNNHKHVKILLNVGADPAYAVQGYIEGGNDEFAEDFILSDPMALDQALFCYARSGNHKKVEELIQRGGHKIQAIIGYIHGGYCEYAEKLSKITWNGKSLAARAYAELGNIDRVQLLINEGVDLMHVILGFIEGEFYKLANTYLQLKDKKQQSEIYKHCVYLAASRGRSHIVKKMLDDNSHDAENLIQYAAAGYSAGLHIKQVNQITKRYPFNHKDIIVSAIRNKMFELIETLDLSDQQIFLAVIDGLSRTEMLKTKAGLLHILSYILNREQRELFVSELIKLRHVKREFEEIRNAIIDVMAIKDVSQKADSIHEIMEKKGFNYWQAVAWNDPKFRTAYLKATTSGLLTEQVKQQLKEIHPIPTIFIDGLSTKPGLFESAKSSLDKRDEVVRNPTPK